VTDDFSDCTPKAVTHRIAKFRNAKPSGGDGGDGKGEGSANENGTATPKAKGAKGKKAAGEPKAKGKKGKGADERTPSPVSGDEGAGGMVTPPDTTTKKGSKRKSASADVDKESKKIKVEEGEEIAEGETEVEEGEITA
jgi:hypothetical protein